ncbi:MAG: hypothetical protein ABII90_01770 [Bacteroidota bacterium]
MPDSTNYLYNINDQSWRQMVTPSDWTPPLLFPILVFAQDENANLILYANTLKRLWNIHVANASLAIKTKIFTLDLEIPKIIRNIFVKYKSATDTLSLNTYQDNLSTVKRDSLTISSYRTIARVPINMRAKQTMVEITSPNSLNDVEIDEIIIEYDK